MIRVRASEFISSMRNTILLLSNDLEKKNEDSFPYVQLQSYENHVSGSFRYFSSLFIHLS